LGAIVDFQLPHPNVTNSRPFRRGTLVEVFYLWKVRRQRAIFKPVEAKGSRISRSGPKTGADIIQAVAERCPAVQYVISRDLSSVRSTRDLAVL
jgi:hypothetical protein